MSATTAPARPDLVEQRPSPARRVWALARLELTLLVRNRTALFNALALAPLTVLAVSSFLLPDAAEGRGAVAATLLGTLLVFALVFADYYNLCTTTVARREELMLKRLTTGELTRGEVLVAMSVPAFAVILAQVVLGAVAVAVLVEAPPLRNPCSSCSRSCSVSPRSPASAWPPRSSPARWSPPRSPRCCRSAR